MNTINNQKSKPEDYRFHSCYDLIKDYKDVEKPHLWLPCLTCGALPKVWVFDNGEFASCKCHNSRYSSFTIKAESIMSIVRRENGSAEKYDRDNLRKNWNHFVNTGEFLYINGDKK